MPAFLKVYTDSGHSSEVAHTTNVGTTLNGSVSAGATTITLTTTTNMPAQGQIDIIDATNGNETICYSSISGSVLTLAKALAFLHPNAVVVNQWYYLLAVGDQTNGIANDGTNATPVGTNTATWYAYNAGDQIAQSPVFATASPAPSTASGFADTNISITSDSTGFAASVSPANIAVAGQQQFWIDAQIPTNQSIVGNPQLCVLNLSYNTI